MEISREYLIELKEKDLKDLSLEDRTKMSDYLKVKLCDEDKTFLKELISKNPENWATSAMDPKSEFPFSFHMGGGMHVRNMLRSAGFNEKRLGIQNLDNVYIEIIEEAMCD